MAMQETSSRWTGSPAKSCATAIDMAMRWSSRVFTETSPSRTGPSMAQPSSKSSSLAPAAASVSPMAASRSDSLTRSSLASRITVRPRACGGQHHQHRQLVDEPRDDLAADLGGHELGAPAP